MPLSADMPTGLPKRSGHGNRPAQAQPPGLSV